MDKNRKVVYDEALEVLSKVFDLYTRLANRMGVTEEQQAEDVCSIFDQVLVLGMEGE